MIFDPLETSLSASSSTLRAATLDRATPKAVGRTIEVLDFEPQADDVRAEALAGLMREQKTLPCKLFYDAHGSHLFDLICDLPEYYPTRTELGIMRSHIDEMVEAIGSRPLLVEYGSGSSLKTRVLLDHLRDAAGYVPIDISRSHLLQSAKALAAGYSDLAIKPVCADYTQPFELPTFSAGESESVVAYFPGSTIGNFEPADALAFLKSVRNTCGRSSGLLIGVDLKKDPAALHAAYNDAQGVTADFNLNLLTRLNREIGSDFAVDAFAHYALYNPRIGRMEMHLVSQKLQAVNLSGGAVVRIEEGESIHTESCYKYTPAGFETLAGQAGYERRAIWTDPRGWFSVQYFVGRE